MGLERYHGAAVGQRAAQAEHAGPAADRVVHVARPAVLAEGVAAARRAHIAHVVAVEADVAGLLPRMRAHTSRMLSVLSMLPHLAVHAGACGDLCMVQQVLSSQSPGRRWTPPLVVRPLCRPCSSPHPCLKTTPRSPGSRPCIDAQRVSAWCMHAPRHQFHAGGTPWRSAITALRMRAHHLYWRSTRTTSPSLMDSTPATASMASCCRSRSCFSLYTTYGACRGPVGVSTTLTWVEAAQTLGGFHGRMQQHPSSVKYQKGTLVHLLSSGLHLCLGVEVKVVLRGVLVGLLLAAVAVVAVHADRPIQPRARGRAPASSPIAAQVEPASGQ